MTSVLWVAEQGDNALTYYRQIVPGSALSQAGWTVGFAPTLVGFPDGRVTGWREGFPPAAVPDIVVARNLIDPTIHAEPDSSDMITAARAAGQRFFFDLDDDLWDLPESNPAARFWTPDQLVALENNLNASDGVLVSTPPLAKVVRSHTAGVPVSVCPNGILVDSFLLREPSRPGPVALGWLGLMDFRSDDLAMIASDLATALAGRGVRFVHVGAHSSRPSVRSLLGREFPVPVEEMEWVVFSELPTQLVGLSGAVVPMRDNAINSSRSATTGLALAAAGVPMLASASPAFIELSERVPGVYVITNDNWVAGLGAFLDALETGKVPAPEDMRRAVRRWYGPKVVAESWRRAFSSSLALSH